MTKAEAPSTVTKPKQAPDIAGMSRELFQFLLRPLEQVEPWAGREGRSLHWFGLTDGEYWLQAGDQALFEYSSEGQLRLAGSGFCEYQVARLYEDIFDLAPYALEPVPDELQRYIAVDRSQAFNHYLDKWYNAAETSGMAERTVAALDDAGAWIGKRQMDTGYLTPSANIAFWSSSDLVHIQWDNRDKLIHGCPAWSAQFGSWQLTHEEFKAELRSFHDRLMKQMAERVALVMSEALRSDVYVDLEGLHREQHFRSMPVESALRSPTPPTDWTSVIRAIRSFE